MSSTPRCLKDFQSVFQRMGPHHMPDLADVYAPSVSFIDPFGRVNGRADLHAYFTEIYRGVSSCRFDFGPMIHSGGQAAVNWRMTLAHPKLNGGKAFEVDGMSHLRFDELIDYHRDYFDAGAMLYENVPLLGAAVRFLKGRMAS